MFYRYGSLKHAWIAWQLQLIQRQRLIASINQCFQKIGHKLYKQYVLYIWRIYVYNQRLEAEADRRAVETWRKVQGWLND